MRTVLVTGGTGFIGSHLIKKLVELGMDVHLVVRKTSKITEQKHSSVMKIHIHVYDGQMETMTNIFKQASPDLVIHLASLFIAEHSSEDIDELIKSNILLGTHTLEAMKVTNVKYIINTGTNWQNYLGTDYNPVDLYAATKQAFESIAMYYTQTTNIRMLTLKLYDTYGPNDKRNKILSLFNRISETQNCLDMSKGEQLLGMVYIDDVVKAFLVSIDLIMTKDLHYQETFFLNPDTYYTLKDLAKLYEKIFEVKLNINFGARPYRKREVMKPYIGMRLPGWEPIIDLQMGLILIKKSNETQGEVLQG